MTHTITARVTLTVFCLVCAVAALSPGDGWLRGQGDTPPEVMHYADLVLYNGKVLTADENSTMVQAVAARDGKILAVGETARILKMAGPKTVRIDLQGNTVTPGFIDVHSGTIPGGHGPSGPSYLPNYSRMRFEKLDDGLRQIKEAVEKAPAGQWVFINPFRTAAAYQVTRQMLDTIAPNNPLLLTLDNTTGIVNSKALAYVPDDVKAGIYKDDKGQPTGRIAGWAYGALTYEILPWPEDAALERMIQQTKERLEKINRMGVTTLGGRRSGLSTTIMRETQRRGLSPVRLRIASEIARLNPHTERYLKRIGNLMDVGDEWFKIASMTVSSIDSNANNGGYLTRQAKRNMETWDAYGAYGQNKWRDMVEPGKDWQQFSDYNNALIAANYGWNVTDMHVQGDGGVELMLEVFDKVNQRSSIKGKSFGMVHGSMRPPDLAKRLATYDAVLSFDTAYLFRGDDSSKYLEKFYGADAVAGMSPIREMIDAGLRPVLEVTNSAAYDPAMAFADKLMDDPQTYLQDMELFITRKNFRTGKVWGPHLRIKREEALKMATAWASRFYGDEKIMGTIEPGKLADFAVLGGDFMTVPEDQISKLPVVRVIVGGKTTFEKK
ncbi:MAG: amidohydrolase family protein [Acidobacteria bacterium]|nr:amidohydrolase family protein [Acidobacteriota bacterium]